MEVGGTSVKNKNKSSTVGKPLLYIAQVSLELAAPKIKRIIVSEINGITLQQGFIRLQAMKSLFFL